MGISLNHFTSNRVSTGSVSSMTLSISAAAGQLAVVEGFPSGGSSGTPVNSVTDNGGGNTWAIPGGYPSSSPPAVYTGGIGAFIAYCNVSNGFSSVTVNIPTASEFTVCVSVWIGVKTSFPLRQGTGVIASSVSLNALGGNLTIAGANTSNANSLSGESSMMINRGNLAGYGLPGPNETVTMSWSPSQNGAAVMAEFIAAPPSVITIYGTATMHDFESLTSPDSTIAPTATITDSESLTAVSGSLPHVAFSAVQPDQNDPNGIPLIHGLTSYHYPLTTSTTYDYWMSIQDGQLGAGLYGAARNSGMTVHQAVPTWTDSGSNTLGMVRTYSANSTSNLGNFTTEADVPGASVSVVVTGSNATVIVHGQFDFNCTAPSANVTLIGYLNWNGSDRSEQAVFVAGAVTARACCARTWRITGVTAGTYTAKLRASCNVLSTNNVAQFPHTGLTVEVIDM
jgi:hypothetical protein